MINIETSKIRALCLVFGFLLIVGLWGAQMAEAWVSPSDTPPEGNVPEPLHVGVEDQAKEGSLTLGNSIPQYTGDLNVDGWICLNGSIPGTDCIDEWPTGGAPGGSNYWGQAAPSDYIYPIVNSVMIGDVKIYGNAGSATERLYVKGDPTIPQAAIKALTYVNGGIADPTGRGAISGRDDSTASVGNPVWGVMGMAGGLSDDWGGAPTYLNYGVYGYAPSVNGVGVSGYGTQYGVLAGGYVGVLGGGTWVGGRFSGSYGVAAFSPSGGTGLYADGYVTAGDPPVKVDGVGRGIEAYAGEIGVYSALSSHLNETIGVLSQKITRGGYIGLPGEIPEEDSYIGVKGIASELPVVGFNSINTHRTYGALGRNSVAYGGYIGAFGRGEDFGVYGISETGTGIFACSGANCSTKNPASNYGLYANNTGATQDAIKGECDACQSAIAGIHYGNGNGIYGQGPDDNSTSHAGWFDGQVWIDGVNWNDNLGPGGSDIGVVIGSSEKSGDSIKGTQNLWLWAQTGDPNDEPSVRVKDKLDVYGTLAVNGDHIKLTDGQDCSGLAAPAGGGAWGLMGTINYMEPPLGASRWKALCVVNSGPGFPW